MLSEDGMTCVSGSADHTIRVWDVGMRRCVHVFHAHEDSAWSLGVAGRSCGYNLVAGEETGGAGGSLSEVFSGGRDGLLIRHDLRSLQSSVIAREESPLQAFAVPADGSSFWIANADSHVRRVPASVHETSDADEEGSETPLSTMMETMPQPVKDNIVIPGTPRLTDFRVLHNKRQVLLCDACQQLSIWDVTNGQLIDVPTGNSSSSSSSAPLKTEDVMRRALLEVDKPVSVPNWFSCDLSLGSLSVHLDANQCFKAESEDVDTLVPDPGGRAGREGDSTPVNLGVRTLRALFDGWTRLPPGGVMAHGNDRGERERDRNDRGERGERERGRSERHQAAHRSGGTSRLNTPTPRVFSAFPDFADERWAQGQPPGATDEAADPPAGSSSSSALPPTTALVLTNRNVRAVGYRGRLYCGLFNGMETPDILPRWVVDIVWNQQPPPEELCGERTMAFQLLRCATEVALPSLPHHSFCLAAPRMRVRRLMGYLIRTLDFDWTSPTKSAGRRTGGLSLVARLGRCCTVPSARQRHSSEETHSKTDEHASASARSGSASRRNRAFTPTRTGYPRDDEDGFGSGGANRIRVDGNGSGSPQSASSGSRSRGGSPSAATNPRCVEVLCNDFPLDPEMSLATARDFVWRQMGKEMVLTYRRSRSVTQAPPPQPVTAPVSTTVNSPKSSQKDAPSPSGPRTSQGPTSPSAARGVEEKRPGDEGAIELSGTSVGTALSRDSPTVVESISLQS